MSEATTTRAELQPATDWRSAPALSVILLFLLAIGFNVWGLQVGWKNSITNMFSFRQTQTAISARSIQEGGPILAYEIPVLGPPWSVPIEFPFFQGVVGYAARVLPVPLIEVGRLFSILFFYLTLWPSWYCLAFLSVGRIGRLMVLTLIAISPLYIFWSRAFMIESTALFFSVSYLAAVLKAQKEDRRPSPLLLGAIAVSGSLAGVIKITTFAAFFLAGAIAMLLRTWRKQHSAKTLISDIWPLSAACILPPIATLAWTQYADAIKSASPMSAFLTSKALFTWTFGTLGQRLEADNYVRFGPVIDSILGNRAILAAIFIGLLLAPMRRKHIAYCLALWMTAIAIFFNLHYLHSYYAYANGVFLIAAVGLSIVGLYERGSRWRWVAVYLLAFSIGASVARYVIDFYPRQLNNSSARWPVAQVLAKVTKADEVVLVDGLGWSPELAFLAHRRAIMTHFGVDFEAGYRFALSRLAPRKLGAVVICDKSRADVRKVQRFLQELAFDTTPFTDLTECDIYLPQSHPSHGGTGR